MRQHEAIFASGRLTDVHMLETCYGVLGERCNATAGPSPPSERAETWLTKTLGLKGNACCFSMLKDGIPSSPTHTWPSRQPTMACATTIRFCCSDPQAERSVKRFRGFHKSSHCLRRTAAVEAATVGDGSVVADLEAPFSPELMSGGVVSTVLRKGKCDIKTQLSWNHQPAGNHQFVQSETSAKYILLGSPNNTSPTAAGLARPPRPLLPSLGDISRAKGRTDRGSTANSLDAALLHNCLYHK